MDVTARLLAMEEVRQVKARYFRFVDKKMWPELRALFTTDATVHFVHRTPEPEPIHVALERIERVLTHTISVHHGHVPEIEIIDADNATAIWPMEDRLYFSPDHPTPFGYRKLLGFGHYFERYVRIDGAWRIASMRLERITEETELAE